EEGEKFCREKFKKALVDAEDIVRKKALGISVESEEEDYQLVDFQDVSNTLIPDMSHLSAETMKNDEEDDTTPRKSSRQCKQVCQYSLDILPYIRQSKPILRQIFEGKKYSERHDIFRNGSQKERDKLKRRSGFGPVTNEDVQHDIMEMLREFYQELDDNRFAETSYVSDVMLPEPIKKTVKEAADKRVERLKERIKRLHEEVEDRFTPKEQQTALKGYLKTHGIAGQRGYDPKTFIARIKPKVLELIGRQEKPIKVKFIFTCGFIKEDPATAQIEEELGYFHTEKPEIVTESTDLSDLFDTMTNYLLGLVEQFQKQSSGWQFDQVEYFDINIDPLEPLSGSSYIPLPCLNSFRCKQSLEKHSECCGNHEAVRIEMPKIDKDGNLPHIKFKNYNRKMRVPFVVYADFESFTENIDTCSPDGSKSFTKQYQKHKPSGFCYLIKCFDGDISPPELVRYTAESPDEDIPQLFVESLESDIKKIYDKFRFPKKVKMTPKDKIAYNDATHCHICEGELGGDKVLDHCHLTGKYR
ncbi:predicted protein, partial [Nematostella vectensis]